MCGELARKQFVATSRPTINAVTSGKGQLPRETSRSGSAASTGYEEPRRALPDGVNDASEIRYRVREWRTAEPSGVEQSSRSGGPAVAVSILVRQLRNFHRRMHRAGRLTLTCTTGAATLTPAVPNLRVN